MDGRTEMTHAVNKMGRRRPHPFDFAIRRATCMSGPERRAAGGLTFSLYSLISPAAFQ